MGGHTAIRTSKPSPLVLGLIFSSSFWDDPIFTRNDILYIYIYIMFHDGSSQGARVGA
jgi:hypothetical protein